MTEYDYSPEAYAAARSTDNRIRKWRDGCERYIKDWKNPFIKTPTEERVEYPIITGSLSPLSSSSGSGSSEDTAYHDRHRGAHGRPRSSGNTRYMTIPGPGPQAQASAAHYVQATQASLSTPYTYEVPVYHPHPSAAIPSHHSPTHSGHHLDHRSSHSHRHTTPSRRHHTSLPSSRHDRHKNHHHHYHDDHAHTNTKAHREARPRPRRHSSHHAHERSGPGDTVAFSVASWGHDPNVYPTSLDAMSSPPQAYGAQARLVQHPVPYQYPQPAQGPPSTHGYPVHTDITGRVLVVPEGTRVYQTSHDSRAAASYHDQHAVPRQQLHHPDPRLLQAYPPATRHPWYKRVLGFGSNRSSSGSHTRSGRTGPESGTLSRKKFRG